MYKLVFISLLLIFFSGCSMINKMQGGPPDAGEAQKRFEKLNEIAIQNGTFKVTDFQKINGALQANGEQYTLNWKATIIYLKEASIGCCLKDPKLPAGGTIAAGETREFTGDYVYFRTDNGWKMRDAMGKFIEPY